MTENRQLRLGMVGGGPGSFIGPVHRMGALLDGRFTLAAGAFSRTPEKCREQGVRWGVDPERSYVSWEDMITGERMRPDGIDALAIVTPNYMHYPVAHAALRAGLPVICDKPVTTTLEEAEQLRALVRESGVPFAITYTYAGYAMIREARARIAAGALGAIRKIVVEYWQGWLATSVETENLQAQWRTDPNQAGAGGCIGDIGTHAFHLAEYVTGLRVKALCADLPRVVPGRTLDDDCSVLLRFQDDQPGLLAASQVATGERNGLRLRVYGETGGLEWCHEHPDRLRLLWPDAREEILYQGGIGLSDAARRGTRLPAGHPEGFIEAFATLYQDFADVISAGTCPDTNGFLPCIEDGVRSMHFIEAAIKSHATRSWHILEDCLP
ncbi:Gfo/Idh/MocA family protein [Acetobacter sp.]|uniref:Gfo/Idh/MocA family protein n=1 Tax=Acetobacter sp. TaxID=440 RepID=UPI0025C0E6E2|nr:Gfo/Idh/MocA family oxidoreductase [Acetobacter sp.]MCH4090764.1 Gfo/Idh/MocA family oxidoreductase [Acetobacter sp.]MCI1300520.1 Gfo/Idh/MocA family oxidoreductase [Acetobacter sp.]MCI1316278.1 Gfo/Idh/MocA family oxidoreductase [Acetobacter sp.]